VTLLATSSIHLSRVSEIGLGVAALVWLWALIDLLTKPGWAWKQAKRNKPAWIVVVVVLGILGALLYVLLVRGRIVQATKARPAPGSFAGAWDAPHDTSKSKAPAVDQLAYQQSPSAMGPFGAATGGYGGTGTMPGPAYQPQGQPAYQPQGQPAYQPQAEAPSLPPAAWQPDPTGRHQLRYWDGSQWTEHVADNGTQAVDPLAR
jgi:hypothetical protein